MQKIIIFNSNSFIYGAERGLINLVRALKQDYKITVVLPSRGPLVKYLKAEEIKIKISPLPILILTFSPLYYLRYILLSVVNVFYFSFYIIYYRFNIIYTNTALILFPLVISKIVNRPHIWHLREFFSYNFVNRFIRWMGEHFSSKIVCMSENIKNNLFTSKRDIKIIYEALDFYQYKNYRCPKEEFKIFRDSVVISMISRIHPLKGQYEFLKFAEDIFRNEDIVLLIVGDITPKAFKNFIYKKKIKNFVRVRKLEKKIYLLGFREDIDRILSLSDICVFPFLRNEPLGLAMLEALAFGKKVLFNPNRGAMEVNSFFENKGEILSKNNLRRIIGEIKGVYPKQKVFIPVVFSFDFYKKDITSFVDYVVKNNP